MQVENKKVKKIIVITNEVKTNVRNENKIRVERGKVLGKKKLKKVEKQHQTKHSKAVGPSANNPFKEMQVVCNERLFAMKCCLQ